MKLILASTSPFRKSILEKLCIKFETLAPNVDESRLANETPQALVERLAIEKARDVANKYNDALVIGSDQVAIIGDTILGKPGSAENAFTQLQASSGKTVIFYTGLCVLNSANNNMHSSVERFAVTFRDLSNAEIETYINKEQPLNCAGSFKSEGLGIALFEKLQGDDPNTLIGLPLIRTIEFLKREGLNVL